MAIHNNKWWPDTCDCCIEFSFDDELADPVVTPEIAHHKCAAHAGETTPLGVWNVIKEENQRKNITLGQAKAIKTTLTDQDLMKVTWSWDANRNITLYLHGILTTAQVAAGQTWCNNRWGVGKVVLVE